MAKLLSYYRLCPLIDTKSLLGISEGKEKGTVIVTLGKNIGIKYRFSDQKQLNSWRTRDKFSSPVIYDKNQDKYVAVFNETFVKIWNDEDEALDKLKKYKFNKRIYSIFSHNGTTYVVFENGSVYPLDDILKDRKCFEAEDIFEKQTIHDVLHFSANDRLFFGLLVNSEKSFILYWTEYNNSKNKFCKIDLNRDQFTLKGYSFHWDRDVIQFLTVWDDGRVYSKELKQFQKEPSNFGDLFCVVDWISAEKNVKLAHLNENYIVVYGADLNEEGAILFIYNTHFKVTQCKQVHKLFTNDAKIWQIDSNLLMPVGQNLVVVPFRLESEELAALVGSHKPVNNKMDLDVAIVQECEVTNWTQEGDKSKKKISRRGKLSDSLQARVNDFLRQGLPESLILEEIMPDVLEIKNIQVIEECLKFFVDIPEKFLAALLKLLLSCDKEVFSDLREVNKELFPTKLQPKGRTKLLDTILRRSYSDVLLLPHLRSQVSIEEVVSLLQYFVFLLSTNGHNLLGLTSLETEIKLIGWSSILIDSNYQKLILSKDIEVSELLDRFKTTVLMELEVLDDLKQITPLLLQAVEESKGKNFGRSRLDNCQYSVEQMSFF
ncbi:nucleolar protein 11 [Cylas formicarius]|uniref:nucleolar protein 11 n=1 Tax=Cylas formicarius TaxID=197179 RepID=UPI002958B3FB|nr:nucleolar protein 11 [Cylas formicarius]